MIINSSKDVVSVLIGLIIGMIIAFIYDIFKSFRKVLNSKKIVICFQDIIYSLLISIITFLILFVYEYGQMRWFVLLSQLLGFIFYRVYISLYVIKTITSTLKFLKTKLISPILKISKLFSNCLNLYLDKIFYKISKKFLKHN